MFSLVSALCSSQPWFVREHGRLLGAPVLGGLGEGDPTTIGPLWEAALLLLRTDQVPPSPSADAIRIYMHSGVVAS